MAQRPDSSDPSPLVEEAVSAPAQEVLEDSLKDFHPQFGTTMDIPEITVEPQHIADVCRTAKDDPRLSFKLLLCLAGVDYREYLQVVYVLLSIEKEHKLVIKTNVPYDDPRLPTVTSVWRAADWYEREAHDLFGIVFDGHPGLNPLVLYEGFPGHPGRKDHPFHDYQEF